MKKKILLILFVFSAVFTFAQSKTTIGIRAGVSSANMRGDAVGNLQDLLDFTNGMITTSGRNGFFAGAYANIPINGMLSVEPSLYYSQKGYTLNGGLAIKGIEFLNAKAQLQTNYIDIPVVLKVNISGFQVFAGPQVSYLANANLRTTAGAFGFNLLNNTMNATEQFNRWDMGLTGGVGYNFANGVNITATYDHGLTKADANKNLSAYNRAFKVGVGFRF